MTDSSSEKPKIIVDEDWKTRVQAEKETAQHGKSPPQAEGADSQPPDAEATESLPPATFSLLVTTIATQALVSLGQAVPPGQDTATVNLDLARHYIDTLNVLEEKTKGNLTSEEADLVSRLLHEMRMIFVAVSNQAQKPEAAGAD